jgi:hypothetical protein
MKQSHASSSNPSSKAASRHPGAATGADLRDLRDRILKSYVHGNVLDLSKASDFYRREAAVAEVLADYVELLPGSRVRLKNGFDACFHHSWALFPAGEPSPADALAHSLFRIAQAWANSQYVDSLPGDWRCTRTEAYSRRVPEVLVRAGRSIPYHFPGLRLLWAED